MPTEETLKAILNDPASTNQEREAAQRELNRPQNEQTTLVLELLAKTGCASLAHVDPHDARSFCMGLSTGPEWTDEAHDLWFQFSCAAYPEKIEKMYNSVLTTIAGNIDSLCKRLADQIEKKEDTMELKKEIRCVFEFERQSALLNEETKRAIDEVLELV